MKTPSQVSSLSLRLVIIVALTAGSLLSASIVSARPINGPVTTDKSDPCLTSSARLVCYSSYLNQTLTRGGARLALGRLQQLKEQDTWVAANCHSLAHALGHDAMNFYKSASVASSQGNSLCASGYFHGVMEKYMGRFSDADLTGQVTEVCKADWLKPEAMDYFTCLHGLGHGLGIRFQNNLDKAVPYCEAFSDEWQSSSCLSGLYMENFIADGINHQSSDLKASDPAYPCDAVKDWQKSSCYSVVAENFLKVTGSDYGQSFALCDSVEANYRVACYFGLGRIISDRALLNPAKILTDCSLGDPSLGGTCIGGAAANAVYFNRNTMAADELCQMAPNEYKAECLDNRNYGFDTL
ncbi:MAG TPA: hypothetical protein VLF41_03320 [Candidatus Nanoarchaeia archaeon]|nr:hypothetical protein [Candidatus Nanoarchaeia archaeon]